MKTFRIISDWEETITVFLKSNVDPLIFAGVLDKYIKWEYLSFHLKTIITEYFNVQTPNVP